MIVPIQYSSHPIRVPVQIDSETRVIGLIGENIRHSLSPAIHNFAAQKLGLNIVYLVFDVPFGSVRHLMSSLWEAGAVGLNVTTPHKEIVAGLTNQHDLGAVNTVIRTSVGWSADCTDGPGLAQSLRRIGFEFEAFSKIMILGNGGVVKAILQHIAKSFEACPEIVIFRRDSSRDETLKSIMSDNIPLRFKGFTVEDLKQECEGMGGESILIQATNAPLKGESLSYLCEAMNQFHGVFVDLVYGKPSALFEKAKEKKLPCQNGVPMLIEQARLSQKLWWGQTIEYDEIWEFLNQCK